MKYQALIQESIKCFNESKNNEKISLSPRKAKLREMYMSRNKVMMPFKYGWFYLDGACHPAILTFLQCNLHAWSQKGTELTYWSYYCRIGPFLLRERWSAGRRADRAGQVLTINS